ncbi:MAG: HlyC/CorC family transporter [Deltaproteobacteria bacterium]|nr:HlyC/CorC family transporter [Deltaproteobacteria bacterium]
MADKEKGLLERLKGFFQSDDETPPTEAELFEIINASGETGAISDDTHEMLSGVFQLKETQVQEVMVPRTEFTAIAADRSLSEIMETIIKKDFSRYPIFHHNLDQVIGILHVKDILKHLDQDLSLLHPRDIMRPVYFVPETKKISELLQEFRLKGIHIAIAVDEYGGTSGLVTISDLVEEIIGKICEEHHPVAESESLIEKLDDGSYLVNGKTEIEEIEELFDLEIDNRGKFESVGGLVIFLSGTIPQTGENFVYKNLSLTVENADNRRVKRVRLRRITETGSTDKALEAQPATTNEDQLAAWNRSLTTPADPNGDSPPGL